MALAPTNVGCAATHDAHRPRAARASRRTAARHAQCAPTLRRAPVALALRVPCVRRLRAQRLENDEVGNMLPLNLESDEGLGGTSDERFGPDVRTRVCGLVVCASCARACAAGCLCLHC
jgi:hypothetical protein